ncbi:TPA: RNA-protein complex protein Nop10 [Candidatus Micrarchaeota archaeon]|nr:MAG: ribosome biogenesis protein [Candidatus Micrarchaeota archaeon CG1_02_51_15]HII38429.1 RNA-protein complex protein Nop10 [Candidatus Micrarchaeota archaeon]
MTQLLKKCIKCTNYTLNEKCPKCGFEALAAHPPKFSFEDKYAAYRRKEKYGGSL